MTCTYFEVSHAGTHRQSSFNTHVLQEKRLSHWAIGDEVFLYLLLEVSKIYISCQVCSARLTERVMLLVVLECLVPQRKEQKKSTKCLDMRYARKGLTYLLGKRETLIRTSSVSLVSMCYMHIILPPWKRGMPANMI